MVNNFNTIASLVDAIQILDEAGYVITVRQKQPKSKARLKRVWLDCEEVYCRAMYKPDIETISQIAERLKRTPNAILSRLQVLGMVEYRKGGYYCTSSQTVIINSNDLHLMNTSWELK